MHADVLVVGAGHAGVECAWTLRASGFEGSILLVGDEACVPYQRPPLSKALLAGTTTAPRIALRAEEAYRTQNVRHLAGDPVTKLDPAAHQAGTASGLTITYRDCVLATGARARPLPGLQGDDVFAIRTLEDSMRLKAALLPGQRLLVVGGGYLGLEVAATASKLGVEVVVVEQGAAAFGGRVSSHTAREMAALHAEAGVKLHCGVSLDRWQRTATGWEVVDSGGMHHRADLVLVAVGADPNVEVAEAAGARCENGILVDANCRTNRPHLYAIGDCASAYRPQLGFEARIESVYNAIAQARIAAASIVAAPLPAARSPTFWSEQCGRRLQIAGLAVPQTIDREVTTTTARGWMVERFSADVLSVVEAVDSPAEFVKTSQRIGVRAPVLA
jgi:3-phenylpropionate/trans-cinnamate dioxygenase ferredoxin reductase component